MFKKPFKTKSQIQLKSSEKKKFGNDIKMLFPALTNDEISEFSNNRDNILKMKIITYNEEIVEIYLIDKVPMFFDVVDQKIKLPTIYMCWKYPTLLTKVTTNSVVLEKIKNGADLFVPGVYRDTLEFRNSNFDVNTPAAVNLISNSATFAVGQFLMPKAHVDSNSDVLGGRLVKLFHTMGDFLCKVHPIPVPSLAPPLRENDKSTSGNDTIFATVEEANGKLEELSIENVCNQEDLPASLERPEVTTEQSELQENIPANLDVVAEGTRMDDLIVYCFLKAAKTTPKSTFPILPAAFYANHMLPVVPPGESLNVKKTKWKKLSALLQDMATEGVVKLETLRGNEFRVLGFDSSHPKLWEFVDPHRTPVTVEATATPHTATTVQEVFIVTAASQPLFLASGLQKGDEVTRVDVRTAITDYIRREGLALPETPDRVRLDAMLRGVLKGNNFSESMSRMELLAAVLAAMPLQHKVSSHGDLIVHKANLPLVEFDILKKKGNKKVTTISNLEGYGVDVTAFAKALQHAAAASTSVTEQVPGKKGPQVQVQGNQILVIVRMLKENHGISEKFMRGLEKAPKKK